MLSTRNLMFKIVLLGEAQVGKTTLVRAWMGEETLTGYKATLGADISKKVINLSDHKVNITYQVWDLSGQATFKAIREQFYTQAHGAVLVYDITSKESYVKIKDWLNEMIGTIGKKPCILVGNKIDLRSSDSISPEEGKELAEEVSQLTGFKTSFIESAALHNENVDPVFQRLAMSILSPPDSCS
ncbi:MAG: Rab family GTPase [Promethearchaeota archaeon]